MIQGSRRQGTEGFEGDITPNEGTALFNEVHTDDGSRNGSKTFIGFVSDLSLGLVFIQIRHEASAQVVGGKGRC